ncbi:hypothetical protein C4579_01260 [Candidatus Microgenomates bacterium]|nr:MAG: hypothetical protein C4579_01260 [Candidatus Microgenomates bacterium]
MFAMSQATITRLLTIVALLIGVVPVLFLNHVVARDFYIYYTTAESLTRFNSLSYRYYQNWGGNPANTGYVGRAPFFPAILATLYKLFGQTTQVTFIPYALIRMGVFGILFCFLTFYLPRYAALLGVLLFLLIPRLHTYSLSALDGDAAIIFFFLSSLVTFNLLTRYQKYRRTSVVLIHFILLAMLVLVKETGIALSVGVAALTLREHLFGRLKTVSRRSMFVAVTAYVLLLLPLFYSAHKVGGMLYPQAQAQDLGIIHVAQNFPNFLYTLILYLGIEELSLVSVKGFAVSVMLLMFVLVGAVYYLHKRNWELFIPVFMGLVVLGLVPPGHLGKYAADMNLIFLLPFCLPILIVFLITGMRILVSWIGSKLATRMHKSNWTAAVVYVQFITLVLISLKFLNNYLSKPYSLEYTGEFYVPLWSILNHALVIPPSTFSRDAIGILVVEKSPILQFLTKELSQYKQAAFDPVFLQVVFGIFVGVLLLSAVVFWLENRKPAVAHT